MSFPKPDRTWIGNLRDNVARHIAVFALNHIATRWYAAMIEGSIRLGLDAAVKEQRAAAPTVDTEWIMRRKAEQNK